MSTFAKGLDFEDIYKALGKPDSKKEKIFESMKDVYMLALVLGAINDDSKPLKKKSQDTIKDTIFSSEDKRIMDLISLNSTKDINILKETSDSESLLHDIVERYANGGIKILSEMLKCDYESIDNLITVVKEYEGINIENQKIDLADLFFEANN